MGHPYAGNQPTNSVKRKGPWMQLSFDPRNEESVAKAAEMLGLATPTAGDTPADKDAQKELIDRLQSQLNEKRQEIAKLKSEAKRDGAAETFRGVLAECLTEATFAECIRNLDDKILLAWPAIGKGGLDKMRAFADEQFPLTDDTEEAVAKEAAGDPPDEDESTSDETTGAEDAADSESTSDDDDGEEATVNDVIEALHKVSASKGVSVAKKILAKYGAKKASEVKDLEACLQDLAEAL